MLYIYAELGREGRTLTKRRAMDTYKAIVTPEPTAIIICCSDPRFEGAFRNFIKEGLYLAGGEFVLIMVAGGPAALANRKIRGVDYCFLLQQIKFFAGHFESIKEVAIIGHQDCGYYKTIPDDPAVTEREKKDLPKAVRAISETADLWFPRISIGAYYARFADKNRAEIVFEKV